MQKGDVFGLWAPGSSLHLSEMTVEVAECIGAFRELTVWTNYWQSIGKLDLNLYPCVLGRFAEEPTDRETLQRSH